MWAKARALVRLAVVIAVAVGVLMAPTSAQVGVIGSQQLPSSCTTGQVPTYSTVTGVWSCSSAFAASITGTANQIAASASTGAVTLSIPSAFVAPGTAAAMAGAGTGVIGLGGALTTSVTQVATGANTTETDLWSYTLPANSLSVDTQTIHVKAYAQTGANGNTKTVRLYFGGVLVGSRGTSTSADIVGFEAWITRTGSSAQISMVYEERSAAARSTTFSALTSDLSTALILKMTGQNGSAVASDITFRFATVTYIRAGS